VSEFKYLEVQGLNLQAKVNLREKKFMKGDSILSLLGEVRNDRLNWRSRRAVIPSALVSASKRFLRCS